MNERQTARLKKLADWLHANDRKFLFELLVPAEDAQLEQVGGDTARYDAELRPELMRRVIEEMQNAGIEVDIWKIEGVDERSDAEMLAKQARTGEGREGVVCVLLGRGANDEKVDHWLTQAAPVDGFVGFAIGRSIWGDALKGFIDGVARPRDRVRPDRRELSALRARIRGRRTARNRAALAAVGLRGAAMKMRQSLAQFEAAFHEQAVEDRAAPRGGQGRTSTTARACGAPSGCRSTARCASSRSSR